MKRLSPASLLLVLFLFFALLFLALNLFTSYLASKNPSNEPKKITNTTTKSQSPFTTRRALPVYNDVGAKRDQFLTSLNVFSNRISSGTVQKSLILTWMPNVEWKQYTDKINVCVYDLDDSLTLLETSNEDICLYMSGGYKGHNVGEVQVSSGKFTVPDIKKFTSANKIFVIASVIHNGRGADGGEAHQWEGTIASHVSDPIDLSEE